MAGFARRRREAVVLALVLALCASLGRDDGRGGVHAQPQQSTDTSVVGDAIAPSLANGSSSLGNCKFGPSRQMLELLAFLSGSLEVGRNMSSSESSWASTWTVSELCKLQGVTCKNTCQDNEQNLLEQRCYPDVTSDNATNRLYDLPLAAVADCVVALDLGNRGLQGTIDPLAGLTNLARLNVSSNVLTGNLDALLGMQNMWSLDVSSNAFNGSLDAFASLTRLRDLYAGNNKLSGDMTSIGSLKFLLFLDLSENNIEGTLDPLQNLTELQFIYLFRNKISGNLDAVSQMEQLLLVNVANNSMSGSLPTSGNLKNLVALVVSGNGFTEVGQSLNMMPNLQLVDLSRNDFADNINIVLGGIGKWVGRIDLRDNNFFGVLETSSSENGPLPENVEIFYLFANPDVTGVLNPQLSNFQQAQVTTKDEFLYYVLDNSMYASIETVQSNYFKVQDSWISLDSSCNTEYASLTQGSVSSKETEDKITVDEAIDSVYFCFRMPRGKVLIADDRSALLAFNMTYFYTMDACGQRSDKEGRKRPGHLFGADDWVVNAEVPLGNCTDLEDAQVSFQVYVYGTYADSAKRGYINEYLFQVKIVGKSLEKSIKANLTPVIAISVVVVIFVIVIILVIWILLSLYLSYQRQQVLFKMKKNAENTYMNAEKQLVLSRSEKDACCVFTDIQSSTVLRNTSSQLYNDIILVHDGMIRKLTKKHGGLVLATEGDGFVLWFQNVPAGILFCMELQQELLDVSWSPAVKALCKKAYGTNIHRVPIHEGKAAGDVTACGREKSTISGFHHVIEEAFMSALCYFGLRKGDTCFNGPRVRCGAHLLSSEGSEIENVSLGIYSFSGHDFDKTRALCDIGNGGQVLISGEVQHILLKNLDAAKFPQIWHWGGYFINYTTGEKSANDKEGDRPIHHVYEVAPSQGVVKARKFERLRGDIELANPPGLFMETNEPPTKNAVFVCATPKELAATPQALQIADDLFSEMQERFWGWRVVADHATAVGIPGCDSRMQDRGKSFGSILTQGSKQGGSSPKHTGSKEKDRLGNAFTRSWCFVFCEPEDALRFALCCQLELAYATWPTKIVKKYKKVLTASKAPLWLGLPVAFAVHICKKPNLIPGFTEFFATSTHGLGSASNVANDRPGKLMASSPPSLKVRRYSKTNLELCNPNKRHILSCPLESLAPTLGVLDAVANNGQVVATGDLLRSMKTPIANFGGSVIEQLGIVSLKDFCGPVNMYQVLPVQLASRTFPHLSNSIEEGSIISPGAKSAPKAKVGLTFVFTYMCGSKGQATSPSRRELLGSDHFGSSSMKPRRSTSNASSSEQSQSVTEEMSVGVEAGEHMFELQMMLNRYGGYLVDEVGVGNMVLAFDSVVGALCFCASVQRALGAVLEDHVIEASKTLAPFAISRSSLDGKGKGRSVKMGVATVDQVHVADVFEGVDSTTGRRRYSTPILNMASRVGRSARSGQILFAGRLTIPLVHEKAEIFAREVQGLELMEHGYYSLRGFGKKTCMITEVRVAPSTDYESPSSFKELKESEYMAKVTGHPS